jgi:peptidoglycan hydrolase-like protein with peptidoglycan-binding domain
MRKYCLKIGITLLGLSLLVPNLAFAAYNDVQWTADANIVLTSGSTDYTVVIRSGSVAQSIEVAATQVTFVLPSGGYVELLSNDRMQLTNDFGATTICGVSHSLLTLDNRGTGTTSTVIVSIGSACAVTSGGTSGGGGGGGGAPPTTPSTTEDEEEEEETTPVSQMTVAQLQAKIVEIQAAINQLLAQLQLLTGQAGDVAEGFTFKNNLKMGMSHSDVVELKKVLDSEVDHDPWSGNQYFGGRTKTAVIKFQEKYASEILAPYGLTSGTGFVGSSTRAKLNELI